MYLGHKIAGKKHYRATYSLLYHFFSFSNNPFF
jgi:hypothetical protein